MGRVVKVMDAGLVGTLHVPPVAGRHPAMIVLGGSGGGLATANTYGAPLADAGFVVLCLAYFAMDGLPDTLSEISLEYFGRAIEWLRVHPAVDSERLAILGHSRGGEAALLVAATFPALKIVIANAPSHVVWQGMTSVRTSSWTRAGRPLPFVSLLNPRVGVSWREWFEASLDDVPVPADAAIPVERINGAVLFMTGTADAIWPSSLMADRAVARLHAHRFRFAAEHARYEDAGHAILVPPYLPGRGENPWAQEAYRPPRWQQSAGLPPFTLGGTPEGNRLARIDAWPKMMAFLARHFTH